MVIFCQQAATATRPDWRELAELEEVTGTPLLTRRGATLEPPPAGHLVLGWARELIREAESLVDDAKALGREPTGVVRLATTE